MKTFFDKVWDDHVIANLGDDADLLQIDRLVLHELSGSQAVRRWRKPPQADEPEQVFTVIEHLISTTPGPRSHRVALEERPDHDRDHPQGLARLGLPLHRLRRSAPGHRARGGAGAGHRVSRARRWCAATATPAPWAAWARWRGASAPPKPSTCSPRRRSRNRGRRRCASPSTAGCATGVYAKDMILALIGRIGAQGGIGYAAEFAGEAVRALPIEGRLTLCNMSIEFSVQVRLRAAGRDDASSTSRARVLAQGRGVGRGGEVLAHARHR